MLSASQNLLLWFCIPIVGKRKGHASCILELCYGFSFLLSVEGMWSAVILHSLEIDIYSSYSFLVV
jgi:hypothetical protein